MDAPIKLLPGLRLSSSGRPQLDPKAVAALAFPFMLNSAVQAVLNATDTWFIGRLSPAATSAIGAAATRSSSQGVPRNWAWGSRWCRSWPMAAARFLRRASRTDARLHTD